MLDQPETIEPSAHESELLEDAIVVLRFASENIKALPLDVACEIEEAHIAASEGRWSPAISGKLWINFNVMCNLIKPVTIASIRAMRATTPTRAPAWLFRTRTVSDADIISRNYIVGLTVLILVILPLQLYGWFGTSLFKEGDDLAATMTTNIVQFKSLVDSYRDNSDPYKAIRAADLLTEIKGDTSRLRGIAVTIENLSPFTPPQFLEPMNNEKWEKQKEAYSADAMLEPETLISEFKDLKTYLSLYIGILTSFILPILFGLLGATAFVIRHILRQIEDGAYVPASRARNLVRQALGVLMGAVVGLFADLSAKFSLPPLAIAFLAGYGVDSIFAAFDSLTDKFRPDSSKSVIVDKS